MFLVVRMKTRLATPVEIFSQYIRGYNQFGGLPHIRTPLALKLYCLMVILLKTNVPAHPYTYKQFEIPKALLEQLNFLRANVTRFIKVYLLIPNVHAKYLSLLKDIEGQEPDEIFSIANLILPSVSISTLLCKMNIDIWKMGDRTSAALAKLCKNYVVLNNILIVACFWDMKRTIVTSILEGADDIITAEKAAFLSKGNLKSLKYVREVFKGTSNVDHSAKFKKSPKYMRYYQAMYENEVDDPHNLVTLRNAITVLKYETDSDRQNYETGLRFSCYLKPVCLWNSSSIFQLMSRVSLEQIIRINGDLKKNVRVVLNGAVVL